MERKSALLVGASGLVGGELLNCILLGQEYSKVFILVRKPLGIIHPKIEERVIDFDELAQYKDYFKVNDVFCCLGTTIKKAGSQEAFKMVDVEYPYSNKNSKRLGLSPYISSDHHYYLGIEKSFG